MFRKLEIHESTSFELNLKEVNHRELKEVGINFLDWVKFEVLQPYDFTVVTHNYLLVALEM